MDIEIIEFYPIDRDESRDTLTGTLRINLPEIGIHILGIFVSKRKETWFFSIPGRNGTHHETGKWIFYPHIVFDDREKQAELMAAIREKGKAFIESRLADTEHPLIFPNKKSDQTKATDNPPAKETISIAKLKPSTAVKQWIDPPKRKAIPQRRRYG